MKPLSALLLVMILITACRQSTRPHLFPIVENNRIGFIDTSGKVVIKPVFRTAGAFSEGLAPARRNGTYGYIDETGRFVIPPQFDYATSFREGLAIVYKGGQPYFINEQGQKAFEFNFPTTEPFENGRAKVQTASKAFGFIDKQGKLIIDTVFSEIHPFIQGMAVVEGIHHNPYDDSAKGIEKKYETGVIDTLGHFIIPYGKYAHIADCESGYFKIHVPAQPGDSITGDTRETGFVDKTGKLVVVKDYKKGSWIYGNVHCGLAKIILYKHGVQEDDRDNSYQGFINLRGDIVINDTMYRSAGDFSNNRAFIRNKDGDCFIINTQGKRISNEIFSGVVDEGFHNGYALVVKDGLCGVIDTNARFLIKPRFREVYASGLRDGYFFYYEQKKDVEGDYKNFYGIAKTDDHIVLRPVMGAFDRNGFQNGLIKCTIDSKLTYINTSGKIVWQEQKSKSKQLTDLNLDCMNRGYFVVDARPSKRYVESFGVWDNASKKIASTDHFPSNALSIVVRPECKGTLYGKYNGITVFVANTSKNNIDFNTQVSRLYMKVQAKNLRGEWKDIEYLPNSWCGNSYYTLTLQPACYWKFLTPVYEGDFNAKLRIQLTYIDPKDKSKNNRDKKELTLYSNEYEGRINPTQFWRKQDYRPGGIMDPYND